MKKTIIILILSSFIGYYGYKLYEFNESRYSPAMALSVSSDGKHVVSTHLNGEVYVWDVVRHTKKEIAKHANIYSAYFIKDSDKFMWQDDLNDEVHIESVEGKEVLSFDPGLATYGHVMSSDLKHYFASSENWDVISGYGSHQKIIKKGFSSDGFYAGGKLLNLVLSTDNRYLLSSGEAVSHVDSKPMDEKHGPLRSGGYLGSPYSFYSGVVLWDVSTGQPIYKLVGNSVKTFGDISPDNKYVVTGDENTLMYLWGTKDGKRDIKDSILEQMPPILLEEINKTSANGQIVDIKFIDTHGDYLRFSKRMTYAMMYNVHEKKLKKYLPLGKSPYPSVICYACLTIDTAPKANILAIAQNNNSGIIVYKFDDKKQTLKKIWTPDGPEPSIPRNSG